MLRKSILILLLTLTIPAKASLLSPMRDDKGIGENSEIARDNPGEWAGKSPAEALTATDMSGNAIITKAQDFTKEWHLNTGQLLSFAINIIPQNNSKRKNKKQNDKKNNQSLDSIAVFDSWEGILEYIFETIAADKFKVKKPNPTNEEIAQLNVIGKLDPKIISALSEDMILKHIYLKTKITEDVINYKDRLFKKIMTKDFSHTSTFSYGARAKGGDNPHGTIEIKIESKKQDKEVTSTKTTEENTQNTERTNSDRFTIFHKSQDGKSDGIRYSDIETFIEDLVEQFLHEMLHSTIKPKAIGDGQRHYIS